MEDLSAAPGFSACAANRKMLEAAWQVVANEYFDVHGAFDQAAWAGQLQATLESRGGVLHTKAQLYSAAKSMVASLHDPYSEYLEPPAFRAAVRQPTQAELDYMASTSVGVGIRLGDVACGRGRMVTATLAGSSAEEAGIARGDVVIGLDGAAPADMPQDVAQRRLRGPVGSSVDVVVRRISQMDLRPREIELQRRPLQQAPAVHRLLSNPLGSQGGNIEYIRVNYFSSDATRAVMQAIIEGESAEVDGYLIDLRNNPGGVFEEAIAMASYFLDTAPDGQADPNIVETVRASDATHHNVIDNVWTVGMLPRDVFSRHAWGLTSRPLAIITNRGTASASEVFAGALQDNHRGIVIGERTFGKGVVQFFFKMSDGSGVKLTVAKYLTPRRHHDVAVDGGIEADIPCRSDIRPGRPYDACIRAGLNLVTSAAVNDAAELQLVR